MGEIVGLGVELDLAIRASSFGRLGSWVGLDLGAICETCRDIITSSLNVG